MPGRPKTACAVKRAAAQAGRGEGAGAAEAPQIVDGAAARERELGRVAPRCPRAVDSLEVAADVVRGLQRRAALHRAVGLDAQHEAAGLAAVPVVAAVGRAASAGAPPRGRSSRGCCRASSGCRRRARLLERGDARERRRAGPTAGAACRARSAARPSGAVSWTCHAAMPRAREELVERLEVGAVEAVEVDVRRRSSTPAARRWRAPRWRTAKLPRQARMRSCVASSPSMLTEARVSPAAAMLARQRRR